MSEFDRAFAKVLVHEGRYVNDPDDAGGETTKGITRRVYDEYRRTLKLPVQSVKNITNAEVIKVITGRRHRRNWTDEEKARILAESAEPYVNVSAVARRLAKAFAQQAIFVPVTVVDDRTSPESLLSDAAHFAAGRIEIEIAGARLTMIGSVAPELASTLTQHLSYGLDEAGFEVVCVQARQVIPALSATQPRVSIDAWICQFMTEGSCVELASGDIARLICGATKRSQCQFLS
ncbi:hypothetical protein QO002_004518 [Pararhizobium capsulatum DSM 1112]|uniref:TtsA-like Glycoside hydrolase family 108 domain-containing protein n=1 Tax=Pararhizobium capsulatum DSM 1112 TaxID=1121113 RepID=A0ABU0BZP3_9HYPH|nr:glycosyl hydrolase 108 family protein [Pararhizobium capsulatum]MDQ0322312.1 hypothetical protein [Pararhizobium capsulatum DSM 1112]